MIGQTLDHYRVLAQIGEGGMGVVYRARDEVLNRDVALKLLAHGALDKVSPGHLLREAQMASSLSHPNICTIHQVGETGNDFYVVMELIEGRSLSDLITATGLSVEIVTRYGTQIADALAHAHDDVPLSPEMLIGWQATKRRKVKRTPFLATLGAFPRHKIPQCLVVITFRMSNHLE